VVARVRSGSLRRRGRPCRNRSDRRYQATPGPPNRHENVHSVELVDGAGVNIAQQRTIWVMPHPRRPGVPGSPAPGAAGRPRRGYRRHSWVNAPGDRGGRRDQHERGQHPKTQLDDPAWRDYVWAETSMRVDQLANGQPGRISRYDCLTGIRREPSARSPTRCCWTRTTSSPRSIPTPVYGRRRRPAT